MRATNADPKGRHRVVKEIIAGPDQSALLILTGTGEIPPVQELEDTPTEAFGTPAGLRVEYPEMQEQRGGSLTGSNLLRAQKRCSPDALDRRTEHR